MLKINLYKFERSKCKYTDDWYREIVNTEYFNIVGDFSSCEEKEVPFPTGPCVIISNCHTTYTPFLEKLKDKNINYGVIQQSDETLADQFYFLEHKNCKFVARGYIHPHTSYFTKLFHLGLGYGSGYTEIKNNQNYNERELMWGFAGAVRGPAAGTTNFRTDRESAIEIFKYIEPNNVLSVGCGFTSSTRLLPTDYRSFMNNCKFALCPYGHTNNDTHRLYEALEAGCIPVVLKNSPHTAQYAPSYWHAVFRLQQEDNVLPFCSPSDTVYNGVDVQGTIEEIPFIIGDTWEDCLSQVQNILKNDKGEEVQLQCKNFWNKWKAYWSSLFVRNIKKLYEN